MAGRRRTQLLDTILLIGDAAAGIAGPIRDAGARALLDRHSDVVCEVPMIDDAILADVDTPDAYAAITAKGR